MTMIARARAALRARSEKREVPFPVADIAAIADYPRSRESEENMKRDWIWAWISAVPAMVIATIWIGSTGLFANAPWTATGLAFAFTMVVSTGILWLRNQRSIRKIRRSGGEIELVIRPGDALLRAVPLFLTMFGLNVLLRLLITGPAIEWGQVIVSSAATSCFIALMSTAYRKPK